MPYGTARRLDVGSHGNVMLGSSDDVITNGRGTHRQLDIQSCPVHGLGVTALNTSSRVITNGKQTAKISSICICSSPSTIVSGSNDTMIDP